MVERLGLVALSERADVAHGVRANRADTTGWERVGIGEVRVAGVSWGSRNAGRDAASRGSLGLGRKGRFERVVRLGTMEWGLGERTWRAGRQGGGRGCGWCWEWAHACQGR